MATTITPGIPEMLWASVGSQPLLFEWPNRGLTVGATPLLPITIPHGNYLDCYVLVQGVGGFVEFSGSTTQGQSIIAANGTAGLEVGQNITSLTPGLIPNGCQILNINGHILTIGGETSVAASETLLNANFIAHEDTPSGFLVTTVTPSTGITLTDYNFDSTTNVFNVGNGQVMSNYSGNPEGGVRVAFASAGSFSISATFASTDSAYAGALISPPLAVTVT
jgi:hypothetical protein